MASGELLSGISQSDIGMFQKEFEQLLRVGSEMARYYAIAHHDLDGYIARFEKIVKKFNQKYAGIKLKLVKKLEVLEMRILLNEESLQGVYKNAASRIIGMQSAGAKKFNAASVTNGEKFSKEIESAKDALHFTYFFPEIGAYTLFLTKDPHEKMIELHWDKKESHYELSPDFRICAYYALSGEVDRSIKIYGELAVFGFINLLSETESRHWFEKFNPRMLE